MGVFESAKGLITIDDGAKTATVIANITKPFLQALKSNLGNSSITEPVGTPERFIEGFHFPKIEAGVATTVLPIAFAYTTPPPPPQVVALESVEFLLALFVAAFVWVVPWLCTNSRWCCRCWKRMMSRRLRTYWIAGFVVNFTFLAVVIQALPHISANQVFFEFVSLFDLVCDKFQEILTQLATLVGILVVYSFRSKIVSMLGYDSQLVRADLRDCLTCFSMSRLSILEVSILKASGLPAGFGTRSLFLRVLMGVNEPQHSRPRDGCSTSVNFRERLQLNFDPEDDTTQLSIVIKQQEIVGQAVAQLAPAAGALVGAAAGLMTPAGPNGGAALGAIAGIGTANSLGPEVARADFSTARINRMRGDRRMEDVAMAKHVSTAPSVPWREENFTKVDLVPQGSIWIRVRDIESP